MRLDKGSKKINKYQIKMDKRVEKRTKEKKKSNLQTPVIAHTLSGHSIISFLSSRERGEQREEREERKKRGGKREK